MFVALSAELPPMHTFGRVVHSLMHVLLREAYCSIANTPVPSFHPSALLAWYSISTLVQGHGHLNYDDIVYICTLLVDQRL